MAAVLAVLLPMKPAFFGRLVRCSTAVRLTSQNSLEVTTSSLSAGLAPTANVSQNTADLLTNYRLLFSSSS